MLLVLTSGAVIGTLGKDTITNFFANRANESTVTSKTDGATDPIVVEPMIVGGSDFIVALKADGTVWSWGNNNVGQLGLGISTTATKEEPTKIEGLENIKQVVGGRAYVLALTSDGEVYGWGDNFRGMIGDRIL